MNYFYRPLCCLCSSAERYHPPFPILLNATCFTSSLILPLLVGMLTAVFEQVCILRKLSQLGTKMRYGLVTNKFPVGMRSIFSLDLEAAAVLKE